ncbi:unnamed protein product [Orchesella dallaii]|uniref:Uncharacterized protein n=1 Tax=Orchesella dallaii TaxID=48710 RepID=A0ABP1S7Z1_9HEXA
MSSTGRSRWRYHISTRLIIISTISIGNQFFPWCQADDQYDCIMHVYNPNTGKMECSGIVLVDTNADSASDIKAIRLVMIFGFVIFLIILFYHILKHCCTSFGRVRYNYWTGKSQKNL